MIYNNFRYVSDFGDKLYKYWDMLCNKYHVDVKLIICDSLTYSKYCVKSLIIKDTFNRDGIITMLEGIRHKHRNAAETKLLFNINKDVNDEQIVTSIEPTVVIQENDLFLNILQNIMRLDILYEYYKVILKHEMGHILDNYEMFKSNDNELLVKLKKNSEDYILATELVDQLNNNNIDNYDSFLKQYHDIEIEKRANDKVNLTWGDFKRVSKFLDDNYDFEINYVKE